MIQHPAILSLLSASAVSCALMLFAGWKGVAIIRKWDLSSGSEQQLQLERTTYLISTILCYTLFFQIISLFLYIFTADYLHTLFVGAMCAAGTLNANGYGYPVLALKIITALFSGVWLIINHVDNRGYDYPLIRGKYILLLTLAPLVLEETVLQFFYFGSLKAQVITSCCGSLFSPGSAKISSELAGLPEKPVMASLAASTAFTFLAGTYFRKTGNGGYLFAAFSALTFVTAVASLISFVSIYTYELPSHHCPFCLLHREYRYAGYPLYATIIAAVVCGLGVGALMPARGRASLSVIAPTVQRKLSAFSMVLYLLFGLNVIYLVASSSLKL